MRSSVSSAVAQLGLVRCMRVAAFSYRLCSLLLHQRSHVSSAACRKTTFGRSRQLFARLAMTGSSLSEPRLQPTELECRPSPDHPAVVITCFSALAARGGSLARVAGRTLHLGQTTRRRNGRAWRGHLTYLSPISARSKPSWPNKLTMRFAASRSPGLLRFRYRCTLHHLTSSPRATSQSKKLATIGKLQRRVS
jgi:hypothetical protein